MPLGQRFFAELQPGAHRRADAGEHRVRRAAREAQALPYPLTGSVRDEVFTRRGGMYFGIAHLLDYPVALRPHAVPLRRLQRRPLRQPQRRFPEGGQRARAVALVLDGDLVRAGQQRAGQTELAVRTTRRGSGYERARRSGAISSADTEPSSSRRELYASVFELADAARRARAARGGAAASGCRARRSRRKLTTEWFARRVDERYRRCLK